MTLYLLDTDIASYLIKGEASVATPIFQPEDALAISAISVMELQYGAALSGVPLELVNRVNAFLDQIESLAFDDKAAGGAAKVRSHLKLIGKPSGAYDVLIAGHAISLGAVLVTTNTKHFENVPGLMLDNWVPPSD